MDLAFRSTTELYTYTFEKHHMLRPAFAGYLQWQGKFPNKQAPPWLLLEHSTILEPLKHLLLRILVWCTSSKAKTNSESGIRARSTPFEQTKKITERRAGPDWGRAVCCLKAMVGLAMPRNKATVAPCCHFFDKFFVHEGRDGTTGGCAICSMIKCRVSEGGHLWSRASATQPLSEAGRATADKVEYQRATATNTHSKLPSV